MPPAPTGGVLAVTGGGGSPGRTTVALNLAIALGAAAQTVLVELDLTTPAAIAYVDLDPTRNVCTLAHAVRDDPHAWDVALRDELQALGPDVSAMVLCGPPKREMRGNISPALIESLLAQLAARFRWIILDVGQELLGVESAASVHRAALAHANDLLLVSAADLVGLWHARTALDQLERLVGLDRRHVQLVLNRHDARFHHSRQEVEWHLGAPLAAVVPFDHAAMQRAISDQQPVVRDPGSRAGRALLRLAEALNEGKLRLPSPGSAQTDGRLPWWQRVLVRWPAPRQTQLPALPTDRSRPGLLWSRRSRA
jgi:pilus assembly protein CpaE